MLTNNVLQRCFLVRCGDMTGTCFTIDVDNRQYIVTAYHVTRYFEDQNRTLKIYNEEHFGGWGGLPFELVGHYTDPNKDEENTDGISVFAYQKQRFSWTSPLQPTTNGITLYDDAYILGFPYGAKGGIGSEELSGLNRGFPLPIAKKGILSALYSEEGVMLLDAYNMNGFSGGPVVMKSKEEGLVVVGVVSGYQFKRTPVYLSIADELKQLSFAHFQENTGLTIAYSINHALALIDQNPIGFGLSDV